MKIIVMWLVVSKAATGAALLKKVFLKLPHIYKKTAVWSLFLVMLQACNAIKKRVTVQEISCEYCEYFKNTGFYVHQQMAASVV